MSNLALRPNSLSDEFATVGKEERKETPDVLNEEQKALAYMGNLKGRKILKEYMERMIEEMDGIVQAGIERGAPFEELGRLTVVRQTAQDVIRRSIRKVEDNRKE
jgi:hypothetical protein